MKLISNWRDWWKLYSTYFLIALGLLPTIWEELPKSLIEAMPSYTLSALAGTIAVVGVVARVILQTNAIIDKDKATE